MTDTLPADAWFEIEQPVMFQHCDPAGIVFYPRYFEMINVTVERWFAEAHDLSFARMHERNRAAVPLASITAAFHAPSRLGDILTWRLTPRRLGGSSLDVEITAKRVDEQRVTARATLVHVGMTDKRPMRWPAEFRERVTHMKEEE
jgi:4-hydroxybenzoyl-CoA thioesterase